MKLIETFYCIQTEIFGNGTENSVEGISSIKTELIRPSIKISNIESGEKKIYKKRLTTYLSDDSFTINELSFLSKTYGFEIEEHSRYEGYYGSASKINKLYNSPGEIILIESDGKEYLIIEFCRWQYECQPRGAGEDSLGEDITYILGIWESPLLTDEIVAKIKKAY